MGRRSERDVIEGAERGVAAIEYGVMVLLIAFALAAAAGLVGTGINNMMTAVANAF